MQHAPCADWNSQTLSGARAPRLARTTPPPPKFPIGGTVIRTWQPGAQVRAWPLPGIPVSSSQACIPPALRLPVSPLSPNVSLRLSIIFAKVSWAVKLSSLSRLVCVRKKSIASIQFIECLDPWWLSNKEPACQCQRLGSIPGWGESSGE